MTLTTKQKQHLKAKAHALKPIVTIGNNRLTESVKKEISRCLEDHELIKIQIRGEREERKILFNEVCAATGAHAVQLIGGIGVAYKKRETE